MRSDNVINLEMNALILEHLYTVDDYYTFHVIVKSGEFTGAANFCLSKKSIEGITESLVLMHGCLSGRCEISDNDSDAYILLEMGKYGHVSVSGRVGGSHEDQSLIFRFDTDQAMLKDMSQRLKALM